MGRWIRGSGWYPNFRQPPALPGKGSIRYSLEPVHEGFEVIGERAVSTFGQCHLAISLPQSGRGHHQNEPLLYARRTQTPAEQTRINSDCIRPCRLVALSSTTFSSLRIHRRAGAGFVIAFRKF